MKNNHSAEQLDRLLDVISSAGDAELSQIVLHVLKRYDHLYPDTEVIFLSLPKQDKAARKEILTQMLSMSDIVFPSDF